MWLTSPFSGCPYFYLLITHPFVISLQTTEIVYPYFFYLSYPGFVFISYRDFLHFISR